MTKELIGTDAFRAMQVYCKLVLGLKMLPMYETFEFSDFFNLIGDMPEVDKKIVLKEALLLVDLNNDEIAQLCSFGLDKNGVPLSKNNIKSLTIPDQFEVMLEVCLKLTDIKVDSITDDQKKNSITSQSTSIQ